MENWTPDFYIIPRQISEDPDVQPLGEKLYGIIYWLTNLKDKTCTASNETLAKLIPQKRGQKVSEQSVNKQLLILEEKGYITRIFKDKSKRHRSEIVAHISFKINQSQIRQTEYLDTPNGAQNKNIYIKKEIYKERKKDEYAEIKKKLTDFFEGNWEPYEKTLTQIAIGWRRPLPELKKEVRKFANYWLEKNHKGVTRLEGVKGGYFEIGRRLTTWLGNAWGPKPKPKKEDYEPISGESLKQIFEKRINGNT